MASARYTWQIDPDDLKPDAPKELTKQEKAKNFWYYHKWHFLIGGVALALVGMFVWEIVSKVEPDYTIGLLSTRSIPMGMTEQLSEKLTPFCDDRNEDGKVVVQVSAYTIATDPNESADAGMQMANVTRLTGDIQTGESMFFLVDDVKAFQESYGIFAYDDDTRPDPAADPEYQKLGHRWGSCPQLASLELGSVKNIDGSEGMDMQQFLADFRVVARGLKNSALNGKKKAEAYYQDAMKVYAAMTAGESAAG